MSELSTNLSRKRTRNEVPILMESGFVHPSLDDIDGATQHRTEMTHNDVSRLRLEAIFHPKFENENREQNVRERMKDKVASGLGYLEVSLKHSGNLLLWSGGQRYYSKNAIANAFTFVGEILLRQHFVRAWFADGNKGEAFYQECSDYIERNRLTLAFEAVTAVLGHHGDIPKRDFLILTAIADKSVPRFYSTVEILEIAQRFRLPHNDVWVFSTSASVSELFHLYDTTRETGLADGTIQVLNQSANAHVSSIYPHVVFQGNILEGIVIRYVSYKCGEKLLHDQQLHLLGAASMEILRRVPPDMSPCFDLMHESSSEILTVDIRKVWQDCLSVPQGYSNIIFRLGEKIEELLQATDTDRRKIMRQPEMNWNMSQLAKSLLASDNIDSETKSISTLISSIDQLNIPARFAVYREDGKRLLCTIHIFHDKSFKEYQKHMKETDFHLYRGFTIELGSEPESESKDATSTDESGFRDINNRDESLMLKMKFLPYMVRTFCCRNGLKILSNLGPIEFVKYTRKMMNMWNITPDTQTKWYPFFCAWGQYAHDYLNNSNKDYVDKTLPPISDETFYLTHLNHFIPLFENGKIKIDGGDEDGSSRSTFRAMVFVVAITKEKSKSAAESLSKQLGGVRCCDDCKLLTIDDFFSLRAPSGGGLIVSAIIDDGIGHLREKVSEYGKSITIVLVDCDEKSIEASSHPNVKKLKGLVKSWEKMRVAMVRAIDFTALAGSQPEEQRQAPETALLLQPNDDTKKVLAELWKVSDIGSPRNHSGRGLLVMFPCIPGSGKSTLSNQASCEMLQDDLTRHSNQNNHPIITLIGDKMKMKYWKEVKKVRMEQPVSIIIADKNAPRNAWATVGEAVGNGLVAPVVPDEMALCTTQINGVYSPSGVFDKQISHYYPFSLHYLAVCMARVVNRPPKSHIGGLDNSLSHVCLIMLKFYGLYRNLSAEAFVDSISLEVGKSGAACTSRLIQVPFFASSTLLELPQDLHEILTHALQLLYGYELTNKSLDIEFKTDEQVQRMESTLRGLLVKHNDTLLAMAAEEGVSRSVFVEQLAFCVLNISQVNKVETATKKAFIRLVSIDVAKEFIHAALLDVSKSDETLMEALERMGAFHDDEDFSTNSGFVQETHITMAFFQRSSQKEMRSKFEAVIGHSVEIRGIGMLWSHNIAALAIEIPETSRDGAAVPACENSFAHITIWKREGTSSVESNELPSLVKRDEAYEIFFSNPFVLTGRFSFWK